MGCSGYMIWVVVKTWIVDQVNHHFSLIQSSFKTNLDPSKNRSWTNPFDLLHTRPEALEERALLLHPLALKETASIK